MMPCFVGTRVPNPVPHACMAILLSLQTLRERLEGLFRSIALRVHYCTYALNRHLKILHPKSMKLAFWFLNLFLFVCMCVPV